MRVDVPRLFRVWNNPRFTTEEVAAILRLTTTQLRRLAARYKLPPRHFVYRGDKEEEPPTAEACAEIERRKAECREAHFSRRRSEPDDSTSSKVSKWRRGICEPAGGRH